MDTTNVTDQAEPEISEEENPLLFWTAYMFVEGGKKRAYLGNGKGGFRLFKTLEGETGLNAYLDKYVPPARRAEVHIQSVQGKINVPVDDAALKELLPPTLPKLPNILDRLPIQSPLPIATLSRETLPPNAIDQLHEYEVRQKKKRRRK